MKTIKNIILNQKENILNLMDNYEILNKLGGGSFAEVYKAIEKKTGEYVAIKILKKKYSNWEECLELRETKSLKK